MIPNGGSEGQPQDNPGDRECTVGPGDTWLRSRKSAMLVQIYLRMLVYAYALSINYHGDNEPQGIV